MKTAREQVIEYNPDAKAVNVGCKNGSYYNIVSNGRILGKGKSAKNAWKAASRNN